MIPKTPRQAQHTPKKRFGQNFLHDTQVIAQIVQAIRLSPDDNLVEIGPGLGALTEPLLNEVSAMTAIELDSTLASTLKLNIGANAHANFEVICANALEVDFVKLYHRLGRGKFRIVGNLPYNISTPILFYLLGFASLIKDMHFMLQKEVVDRITASPNTKAYGRLSVIMQYHCQCTDILTVPKGAFNPPPKVTSGVFRLVPYHTKPVVADDEGHFAMMVRELFNQRRKTLRAICKSNALLATLDDGKFVWLGLDPQARPESLSVADFVALSNQMITKTEQQCDM